MSKLLTKRELAESLGISVQMVDKLRRTGRLSCVRIGSRVLFQPDEIEGFIRGATTAARAAG
ncbi:MAG: helix-turn-helix domain-containing protein [Planctomycetales bacterium]